MGKSARATCGAGPSRLCVAEHESRLGGSASRSQRQGALRSGTESEEDNEEIAEIVGELDALFGGDVRIDTEVWAGDRWWDSDWPGRDRRLVYAAKD